ncbi:MAG: type II toxin-antitoxin system Phd/YefM family antitoxin [Magnetococcales bacterium]|nr:type II toxin-antitoxin system Phd/YefM family antitoxin [Magnetococcales bacterium]
MNQVTANFFRDHLKSMVDEVVEGHTPLRVSRRSGGDFVVLSADDWAAIEETLYLNQFPGLVASIQQAAGESLAEGTPLEDLEW